MDVDRLLDKALFREAKKGKAPTLVTMNPKVIVMKVVDKIKQGDSQLKRIFERGYTIEQVIWAIKNHKCIANLGSTYLEQTISGTLQDLIKERKLNKNKLNDYRRIFGLPPMQAVNSQSQRPKPSVTKPNPTSSDKSLVARLKKALR